MPQRGAIQEEVPSISEETSSWSTPTQSLSMADFRRAMEALERANAQRPFQAIIPDYIHSTPEPRSNNVPNSQPQASQYRTSVFDPVDGCTCPLCQSARDQTPETLELILAQASAGSLGRLDTAAARGIASPQTPMISSKGKSTFSAFIRRIESTG